MINVSYKTEMGRTVSYTLLNWDAVYSVAEGLINSPIDLEYIDYVDGDEVGTFNLNNFEKC